MNNPSAQPARTPCRKTLWVLFFILLALFAASLGLNCAAIGLVSSSGGSAEGRDEFPNLTEKLSYGTPDGVKVVRIQLHGAIERVEESSFLSLPDRFTRLVRQIRAARQDSDVRAILLEVDSPGGGVTLSDELYHELTLFRKSRDDRRIVALAQDIAASGAYYACLPADKIVAQPTSIIGSIGVILSTVNAAGLAQKIGISGVTIASGENKDLLNPLEPVSDEHVAILRAAVDQSYERFVSLVSEARSIPLKKLRPIADGRVFSADDALKHRLVDSIGYREDALDTLKTLLGADELCVVSYSESISFFEALAARPAWLPDLSALSAAPRPQFLWRP